MSARAKSKRNQHDSFTIAGVELPSRLIMGTGGAPSPQVADEVPAASGTAMCTVAMRRVSPGTSGPILDALGPHPGRLLPNTARRQSPHEAPRPAPPAHRG